MPTETATDAPYIRQIHIDVPDGATSGDASLELAPGESLLMTMVACQASVPLGQKVLMGFNVGAFIPLAVQYQGDVGGLSQYVGNHFFFPTMGDPAGVAPQVAYLVRSDGAGVARANFYVVGTRLTRIASAGTATAWDPRTGEVVPQAPKG